MALEVGVNSYADTDAAEEYFEDHFDSYVFGWGDIDSGDQEKLLVTATLAIDHMFLFYGSKWDEDQTLQFPRYYEGDDLGGTTPDVPIQVVYAVCELAVYMFNYGTEFLEIPTSVKIDKMRVDLNSKSASMPEIVLSLLRAFGEFADSTSRINAVALDR